MIGAMMISATAIATVSEILQPADFYRESHGKIYRAAIDLWGKGEPVDAITLADELDERSDLETVGGSGRISELAALVPAASNVQHYARIVKETAMLRTLVAVGQEITRLGQERVGAPDELLERARSLVDAATSYTPDELRVVPLSEFVASAEQADVPLIGTREETVLPADGVLLAYGDGGAGKTTLSVDAIAHLAAGRPWLDLDVGRPVRVLVIENEGPRGKFRERLNAKIATWQGAPFADNVHVLEEPWTRFTFTDPGHRRSLAKTIDELEIDLVVVGPLATIGTSGGGTPDDVNAFTALLDNVRDHCLRPFAIWIIHHENKAGDVSGAWERVPDTLVHVRVEGKDRSVLFWRKVRHSSDLHGSKLTLRWEVATRGFTIEHVGTVASVQKVERVNDAIEWIVEHVYATPSQGHSKSDIEEAYVARPDVGKGARTTIREAHKRLFRVLEEADSSGWGGEYIQSLAIGPGKSPAGKYLYARNHADSPLAEPLFGDTGENQSDPGQEGVLANSPFPRRGKEREMASTNPRSDDQPDGDQSGDDNVVDFPAIDR